MCRKWRKKPPGSFAPCGHVNYVLGVRSTAPSGARERSRVTCSILLVRVLDFQERRTTMRAITKSLVNFVKKEDGPTAVEYAVMLALIVVVCIAAITTLGSNANSTFSFVGSSIKPTSAAAAS